MKAIHAELWMYSLLVGAATLVSVPVSAPQSALSVSVGGINSQQGNIVVCLWREQDRDFPICASDLSFQYTSTAASAATVSVTFQDVPSGNYALSAFHDENGNGRIDRGFMDRSEEGIAFSNMNPERRERPSFGRSLFTLNGTQTVSLSILYF
jgi:uncharacterized protein (DUF2141 family)